MSTTPTHLAHPSPARSVPVGPQRAPPSPPPAPPLPPPPAPPLPSGKYVQRAATAFGRLAHPFFLGSRPSSAQGHRDGRGRPEGIRPAVRRSSSPLSSRSTTHKTGIPIAALDISPERTHAILAGRDILKTVKLSHASCAEDFNLRSKLSAYASTHHASRDAASAQHRDQLAAKDVKWSCGNFSTTIATAAANGKIVVYDIHRPSIEIGRLHEHARQVHKLAFNPHQGALLISGSQDGTVRMWDMRELRTDRAARIGGSIRRFVGHNDGVRDLKWSPSDGVEFATATDAGTIQRWDFRKENAPLLKLNAHDKPCMSLDWHPSGRYLASGSADKTIKVWDFRSTDRRMKPHWQLRAPQAVMNIRWRPGSAPSVDGSIDSKPTTCLASSYDARDPRIHIWDFRRPHVPFQEIDKYDMQASDFLWHSEDLIWSVGMAGVFAQTDLNFVPKPLDRMSINILTAGADSGLCFFSEPRPVARVSLAEAEDYFLRGTSNRDSSGEKLSGSQEGSLDESSQLANTIKRRRPKFTSSRLTSQSSSSTIGPGEDMKLSDLQSLEPMHRSTQTAAFGRVPGVFDQDTFGFLAKSYQLPTWTPNCSDEAILGSMEERFDHNAAVAARAGQHRLARTWRILGHAIQTEISRRLEELRRKKPPAKLFSSQSGPATAVPEVLRSPVLTHTGDVSKVLHGIAAQSESGSNVQTPLARPVREMPTIPPSDEHSLEQDSKAGVVPLWQQRRASVQLTSPQTTARDHANLRPTADLPPITDTKESEADPISPSFVEFQDLERQMEERRNAMNNYRARPRTLLRLDNPSDDSITPGAGLPPLGRHDSNESFQMFSGSTDSDPRSVALADSFGDSQSFNTSAANSLGSSMTQDLVAVNQMRQSQLRQSHPAGPHLGDSRASHLPGSTEFPLFENMSFPLEHEAEVRSERVEKRDCPPIRRPSTFVAPIVHQQDDTSILNPVSTDLSSLLLANPAPTTLDFPPWALSALLPQLLKYHLETLCDTQLPSVLVLSLYPIYPALFATSPPPPTYLLAYHELLIDLRLFVEAANLRNSAQFIFPDVGLETTVDQGRGTGADEALLWCIECGKPVKGDVRGWCKRCCTEWAECGICELASPPPVTDLGVSESERTEEQDQFHSGTSLWSWCQGCGHGGHTRCLRLWWGTASKSASSDASEGACPIAGCGHACVSGPRRDARLAAVTTANKRERTSNVTRDSWIAGESRAVEAATRKLSGRGSSGAGTKAISAPGLSFGGAIGRPPVEEAVIIVDSERSSVDPSREGLPRSLSGGGRSLSGGGRSLSGGGRRVRLALPGTTPPAASSATAALRELSEHQDEHPEQL